MPYMSDVRGVLTLWALGQCPGAHYFRGPTVTVQTNLKRAQIVAKITFARGAEGVSIRPCVMLSNYKAFFFFTNFCN